MNIILIGMAGSGKTTIGEALGKKLSKKFIDMDKVIEQEQNMTINDIVNIHGWDHFRNLEKALCVKLATMDNVVIATGGGVIINPINIKLLSSKGLVIFLETPITTLIMRIKKNEARPLFSDKVNINDQVKKLYEQRLPLYKKSTKKVINTKSKNIDTIVREIINNIG